MNASGLHLHRAVSSAVVCASGPRVTVERADTTASAYTVRVHQDDVSLARAVGAPLAPLSADLFDVAVAAMAADRLAPRPRTRSAAHACR